jgi:LysR family transcriptional regulator, glycine cleavage system transcriptional activator
MRRLPPLSAIRAFEAAARHQSFTRAARELGMTQAAVSYQIRLLEDRVGTPLFLRFPRHVELTSAGRQLATPVTEALEGLEAAFQSFDRTAGGVLSLSVLPTIAAYWLVPRLAGFRQANPDLAVRLDTSNDVIDFHSEDADMAIRSGLGTWPGLEAHRLLPSRFTPVLSPILLNGRRLMDPAELLDLPLLGPTDPWWQQWFEAAGLGLVDLSNRPDDALGTQQFEGLAAMAGQGVALVNPAFFQAEIQSGRLVQPFSLVVEAQRSYWLVYPRAKRRLTKIKAFRDWVLAEAASTGWAAEAIHPSKEPIADRAGATS